MTGYVQFANLQSQRCECHECTQARWKMSIQGQLTQAMQQSADFNKALTVPLESQ